MTLESVDSEVAVAIIAALQAIMLPIIGTVVSHVSKSAKATQEAANDTRAVRGQVQNAHSVNLRDDIDAKHTDTINMIGKLEERFRTRLDSQERRSVGLDERFNRIDSRLDIVADLVIKSLKQGDKNHE